MGRPYLGLRFERPVWTRFAWLPVKLPDGKRLWLQRYTLWEITFPATDQREQWVEYTPWFSTRD